MLATWSLSRLAEQTLVVPVAETDVAAARSEVAAGAGFEIASAHELRLLARLSVPPEKIIYGSSIKPIAHVKECHEYGIDRFAADSFLEVEKIAAAAPKSRVYIRAQVDDAGSVFQFSEKFGAEIASIVPMLQLATARGLRPYGISFHVGSQASNAAAWAVAIALAAIAVLAMVVMCDALRRNVVPAVAIGVGLSVMLSPHLGDYSLMLLAIPVAVLAPRAPALTLALVAAYTAASLFNPLVPLNESTVAFVLLAGLVALVWHATHPGSSDMTAYVPRRSATGVSSA